MTAQSGIDRQRTATRAISANAGVVFLAFVIGGLTGDVLQMFAAQVLELPPQTVGFVLGALVFLVPLQAAGVALVSRWGKRGLMIRGYVVVLACLPLLAVLPAVFAASATAGLVIFAVTVIVAGTAHSVSWGSAWHAWIRELTISKTRGRFLSRMRLVTHLVTAGAMFLVGALVGDRMTAWDFVVILAGVTAYLLFAIAQFRRLPEKPPESSSVPPPVREQLHDLRMRLGAVFRHPLLRRLAVIQWLLGFLTTPLVALYLITRIGFSDREVAWQLGLRNLAVVGSLLVCGRIIDRLGAPLVLRSGGALAAALTLGWLFLPAPVEPGRFGWQFVLATGIVMANGALTNSLGIAHLTAMHNLVTDKDAVASFAVVSMIDTLRQRIIIALAGIMIAATAIAPTQIAPGIALDAYRGYLLVAVPAAATVWMLTRSMSRRSAAPVS